MGRAGDPYADLVGEIRRLADRIAALEAEPPGFQRDLDLARARLRQSLLILQLASADHLDGR